MADQRDRCRVLEPTGIAACAALALGAWGVSRADALPGAGLDAAMLAMVLGLAVGNWRARRGRRTAAGIPLRGLVPGFVLGLVALAGLVAVTLTALLLS
ncbi:MAG: hypothetical protein QNK03_15730 [Myxococcota bacterium]|nr:hypothetical protein [Myxococcota bacterium]